MSKMDIQMNWDKQMFNCRAVGVCIKDNKILLSKLRQDEYWAFVGGKVSFGETSDAAIIREYQEEIGVSVQIDRLLAVIENFFDMKGQSWHQHIFFYLLRDQNNYLAFFDGERQIVDNKDAIYRWFDLSALDHIKVKPDCAIPLLQNLPQAVQHVINREN